jgi:hypothetical protein
MDRTTIILLCIGFIIVWVVFKRFSRKKPQERSDANGAAGQEQRFDLDKWFGRAQDVIGVMDGDQREAREEEWRAMDEARQLALADEFLQRNASAADAARLNVDERRRVGWAYFLSRLES